jgi:hypothetical protein
LTISYYEAKALEEREYLSSRYCFKCNCKLCQVERKDSHLKQRQDLVKKIKSKLDKNNSSHVEPVLNEANKLLKKLQPLYTSGLYGEDEKLKIDLMFAFKLLADYNFKLKNFEKSGDINMQIFERFYALVEIQPVNCFFKAVQTFNKIGNVEKLKNSIKIGKSLFIGDANIFKYIFCHNFQNDKHLIDIFDKC